MFGILLTFAKLSLKSFIYTLAEILFFPNATVKEIYKKYKIERIIIYHILTVQTVLPYNLSFCLTLLATFQNQKLEM